MLEHATSRKRLDFLEPWTLWVPSRPTLVQDKVAMVLKCVIPMIFGILGFGGGRSVYFSPIGMGELVSSNARRWMVVGVARIGVVGVCGSVPQRMSLRVIIARCSSSVVKLRRGSPSASVRVDAVRFAVVERFVGATGSVGSIWCS